MQDLQDDINVSSLFCMWGIIIFLMEVFMGYNDTYVLYYWRSFLPEYTTFVFSFQARRLLEDSLEPIVHNIMAVVGW